MTTDRVPDHPDKEVTMTKRLVIVALVMAATLVLAAQALAFDGYREGYILSNGDNPTSCESCHRDGPEEFGVWNKWVTTAHAMVGEATVTEDPPGTFELHGTANAEPIADGPGCAGCHASNYDPQKHVEDPVTEFYPWENTAGDDAFSEPFIGCSACHWGKDPGQSLLGGTMHIVPQANMANADICGQCHARYSASTTRYPNYDGSTSVRQYTIGTFNPLGSPSTTPAWTPQPISDFLNIPTPTSPQSMIYYTDAEGELLPWSARGHEEGAAQYSEWAMEGHADSLDDLIGSGHAQQSCLECHSADYRLAEEGEKPSLSEAKYGITCQACHDPHTPGEQTSFWNEERNPQLPTTREELCIECHNGEIAKGATAVPGTAVHHPMQEMMEGRGAIGVPAGSPSVHKDGCVQCHMVPTQYDRFAVPMTGANHIFAVVEPDVAKEATTTGNINGARWPMPYSSCGTCHATANDPYATYLQSTLTSRQTQMHAWDDEAGAELTAAAQRMGYPTTASAVAAINKKAQADWNASERALMSAYTNRTFVESEGSWGIHNWDYAKTVILKAIEQAKSVRTNLTDITIDGSPQPYTTPKQITYPNTVVVSGKIVGGTPELLLGGMAELWAKPGSGTRFTPVASMYLYGDNVDTFSFTVAPSLNTTYKVRFAGNISYEPLMSIAYLDVQVKWRLNPKASASSIKVNKKVTISGKVEPTAAGTVTIQRKKGSGGSWKNVATDALDASSKYSKAIKLTSKATYYFRVKFPADATHLAATSSELKVTVK
jgi:hypothetical protein